MKGKITVMAGILLLALSAASASYAVTAVATFSDNQISIPRIDVPGYGALNVVFSLVDANTLDFRLISVTDADLNVAPSATFDESNSGITIPVLKVSGEYYYLVLQLQAGAEQLFRVIEYSAVSLVGQASYAQHCTICHGADGQGSTVSVSLINCANCGSMDALSSYIGNTMPLGAVANCTGECAQEVADYILSVFNVDNSATAQSVIGALQILSLQQTLRKASLQLVSRLPTEQEQELVSSAGETGLGEVLDGMFEEDAFYRRLSEIFNDMLLTNRYLSSNAANGAINLLRSYPNSRWFDLGVRDEEFRTLRQLTNDGIATAPLQLINHLVKNERPMSEILTADYMMMNPYSARSYGIENLTFLDDTDADEFVEARLPEVPHSGLLTSIMFLNRYPTSQTNRNRGRAKVVYDFFLGVDILALDGVRPDGSAVDISSPAPTMENPDCVICHAVMDPIASSFQNWNPIGQYKPPRGWFDDMFGAGFAGVERPEVDALTSLQWLGDQMVLDTRFDSAMVRIMYRGLTGYEPLQVPGESASTQAAIDAFYSETAVLDEIETLFADSDRNLKALVKAIVLSPYWRASALNDSAYSVIHESTGSARLLQPQLLHRKIDALFGFQWKSNLDRYSLDVNNDSTSRLLDDDNHYHLIYGGIDSFTITQRLTEPNGLMITVQERMSNELACYGVPNDFLKSAGQRSLVPHVELDTSPFTSQGSENAAAIELIVANIQYLHGHLLGETLEADDPEILATYELFVDVLQGGQAGLGASSESIQLPAKCMRNNDMQTSVSLNINGVDGRLREDPDYIVRSWMAVVAYLLADYSFLYE